MSRKVIQICEVDNTLHYLCDDGTVWRWSEEMGRPTQVADPSNAPTSKERIAKARQKMEERRRSRDA